MIAGDPSFRIVEGLVLERSGVLLPWEGPLRHLGSPEPRDPYLVWRDESVLGGLAMDVAVRLDDRDPRAFDLMPIFCAAQLGPDMLAYKVYTLLIAELKDRFGPPHTSGVNPQLFNAESYPWVIWRWNDVQLSMTIQDRLGGEILTIYLAKVRAPDGPLPSST